MQALPFTQARGVVLQTVGQAIPVLGRETVSLDCCVGRVLANDVFSDRPYPPFRRSARDGYAVRAEDLPGRLQVVTEVRAGSAPERSIGRGEAAEIMTGAPVPDGADSIVMVEHTQRVNGDMITDRQPVTGDHIVPSGAECGRGETVLHAGTRLDTGHIPALATVGAVELSVWKRPLVSILATGDELVPADSVPQPHQIRNSNSAALAAQVVRAGGVPRVLPTAPDNYEALRKLIESGLEADLLLLSGGVSAGKFDLVETVLADLGAEFYFTRVLIQPGQPLVFGRARNTFFFGLPGNPLSTMVTFELFARAALDLLSGSVSAPLPLMSGRMKGTFRHRTGLTRFLPANISEGEVTHIRWQGSGDVFSLTRANAFLVARADRETWEEGEWIEVLPR